MPSSPPTRACRHPTFVALAALVSALLGGAVTPVAGKPPEVTRFELANGLRVASNIATTLRQPHDLDQALQFRPSHVTERMLVGNLAIQWGMEEVRYGAHRAKVADAVAKVNAASITRVLKTYLAESKRLSLVLEPRKKPSRQK